MKTAQPALHRETFTIRHSEADRHGRVKLAAWFDFLQEAAANHATELGVGLAALLRNEQLWVLSRLHLRLAGSPQIGDTITVETYPNGIERLFAKRQFRILDSAGNETGCASSRWLLLGREKLRPAKPDFLQELLPDNSAFPDYFPLSGKHLFRNLVPEFSSPVRYTMEDVNGHMNNAQYAGLTQDYLALRSGGAPPRIAELEIQFHAAVRMSDELAVAGECSEKAFFVQGCNQAGSGIFSAEGTLV